MIIYLKGSKADECIHEKTKRTVLEMNKLQNNENVLVCTFTIKVMVHLSFTTIIFIILKHLLIFKYMYIHHFIQLYISLRIHVSITQNNSISYIICYMYIINLKVTFSYFVGF